MPLTTLESETIATRCTDAIFANKAELTLDDVASVFTDVAAHELRWINTGPKFGRWEALFYGRWTTILPITVATYALFFLVIIERARSGAPRATLENAERIAMRCRATLAHPKIGGSHALGN